MIVHTCFNNCSDMDIQQIYSNRVSVNIFGEVRKIYLVYYGNGLFQDHEREQVSLQT